MESYELAFECGEDSLVVRRFALREALSEPFEASIWAVSTNEDFAFDAFVGRTAAFRMTRTDGAERVFRGVCSSMEQLEGESSDVAVYEIHIVADLWLLDQRKNYRVFQHLNAPQIAMEMLEEWGLEASFRLSSDDYPKLEYRVQHGESDLAFLTRLLEEAGITYYYDTSKGGSHLVFSGAPHTAEARAEGPIAFAGRAGTADHDVIRDVRISEQVRAGRVTIRDFDFRMRTDYPLFGRARAGIPEEERLEQYRFEPGSFVVEPSSVGAASGDGIKGSGIPVARADEKEGTSRAERQLAAARVTRQTIAFETDVFDLGPGVVFAIDRHPRADLAPDKRLLVTSLSTEWTANGGRAAKGRATFAREPYVPQQKTVKPRVLGVESAVVVGPPGEEIHTDEFGRIRVQFHWDREGRYDDKSSCFIRVSQGWAGGAYGMMALPRVGQEVVVGFLDGDPDQPLVVGRVFNSTTSVPYKLPLNKTRSTWKSSSSPGSEGFNELMFEDAQGQELVYMRAERNLDQLVKADESVWIGNDRKKTIGGVETIDIGRERHTIVRENDATIVGNRHTVTMEQSTKSVGRTPTGIEMVDGRITLSTGEATITLDGPDLTLEAAAGIMMRAAGEISIEAASHITAKANVSLTLQAGATLVVKSEAGDVVIQGGPLVRINPEARPDTALRAMLQPEGALQSIDVPPGIDLDSEIEHAEEHAQFDPSAPTWFSDRIKPGGEWDYQRLGPQYARYASFHMGVMGKAMGLPEGALLRQSGLLRQQKGDSKPEWGDPGNGVSGGTYPYGADPRDQEMLLKGSAFYDKRFG